MTAGQNSQLGSSSRSAYSYCGNTTSPHTWIVFGKIQPPQTLCLTIYIYLCSQAESLVCFVLTKCLFVHAGTLTIWITEFLQCTAHGCFNSQVPPFGAHSGGPEETDNIVKQILLTQSPEYNVALLIYAPAINAFFSHHTFFYPSKKIILVFYELTLAGWVHLALLHSFHPLLSKTKQKARETVMSLSLRGSCPLQQV